MPQGPTPPSLLFSPSHWLWLLFRLSLARPHPGGAILTGSRLGFSSGLIGRARPRATAVAKSEKGNINRGVLKVFGCLLPVGLLAFPLEAISAAFLFPTANRALVNPGGESSFFVGTAGKSWTSGQFGCVRSGGHQMHEGIDIRCQRRDARGEPNDPVFASADGIVAYINTRPGLSNYGIYVILRHRIEGLDIHTLYAHLREPRSGLRTGLSVKAGDPIGVMGLTSNTRQRISQDRAHVHFEINLLLNDRFVEWHKKNHPGQRNDHGLWNGHNLLGIDPAAILKAQAAQGRSFSLLEHLRNQTELCRIVVRDTQFSWVNRFTPLIRRNPIADREGFAGFEIALNFNGVPFQLIPRAASELKGKTGIELLRVNSAEAQSRGCRRLVQKTKKGWELTQKGISLIESLIY